MMDSEQSNSSVEHPSHVWHSRPRIKHLLDPILASQPNVELEIGSGKGLFLIQAAKANPEAYFVGIEIATKYAYGAQAQVERLGLTNAQFFCADAMQVVCEDIPSDCLSAVHCYFPDPWWKKRHKKRRVLNERMIANIQRILKPGSLFHFWTDVLDYFESTLELIAQHSSLEGPMHVSETESKHDLDYRTHFERRTRRNGLPVYRSQFRKPIG
jgi:tRNA (guanine-N7-)-methyltransferase